MILPANQLSAYYREDYPHDAAGSCLVIGTPPEEAADEPVPVDLVRAVLAAFALTEGNLRSQDAGLRIDVNGAIPRGLTKLPDIVDVLRQAESGESSPLNTIESTRKDVVKAIVRAFDLESGIEVVTLTEKLKEPDARADLIGQMRFATGMLGRFVTPLESSRDEPRTLREELVRLIPRSVRKNAQEADLNLLVNYALLEILWIARKATKNIMLFQPTRERGYIRLAKFYLDQGLGISGQLLDTYVRITHETDGLKLQPVPEPSFSRKAKGKRHEEQRLVPSPAYRTPPNLDSKFLVFGRENRGDDVAGMKAKLLRSDIPERQQMQYVTEMVVAILQIVRIRMQNVIYVRNKIDAVIPQGVLQPEAIFQNLDTLLAVFHELVILPVEQCIRETLAKRQDANGGTLVFPPVVGDEPSGDGDKGK